jgi:hypothetical protein
MMPHFSASMQAIGLPDFDISNTDLGNNRDRIRSMILEFKVQIPFSAAER